MNTYAMAAYTLHHQHCSVASFKLSQDQKEKVQTFFVKELHSEGLAELLDFQDKRGFFQLLFDKNIENLITFWNAAKVHYPTLNKLVLRLLRIPASSATIERLFSQWSFVHNKL